MVGASTPIAPNAPSTCSHSASAAARSARAAMSSMAPTSTVPAEATNRQGVKPAAWSAAIAALKAARSIRWSASTPITRRASLPSPDISMARRMQEWAPVEA